MANSISSTSSPLPPQADLVSRTPVAGAVREANDRQTVAAGGKLPSSEGSAARTERDSTGSAQAVEQATRDISDYIQSVSRSLQISIDGELGTPVIKVLDAETEEIVRQIPAEETLQIARILADQQTQSTDGDPVLGLLLDSEG